MADVNSNTNKEAREKAKKRVKELKDFYDHVQSYILVNFVLFLINTFIGGFRWHLTVLFFWGIGLLFHAASVYWSGAGWWGSDWEEKKLKELEEKYSNKQ